MYGLLLENLATFIKAQWGEGKWESVRRHAGIDIIAFSIHHVYPETLMRRIARSAFQVLGVDERQFFKAMGVYFVQYVSTYGYDQLLSVLGRHLRDFLNGLDNLHEYLKFSYPKMRAPSFYCDDETESGLKLHYRSKRRGFVYYVMGQIKQVAKQFYNQECNIHLLSEEVVGETIHVVFELAFDNSAFSEAEQLRGLIGKDLRLPVRASTLFELFPFCIVFNSEMEITHTGHTLMTILKDLIGQVMTEAFDMTRPLIPFCFSAIMQRRNNIFELVTVAPIHDVNYMGTGDANDGGGEIEGTRLRLRGQMLYMEDWNMMLYLANPVMPDLNGLVDCSLFINDLSLHDCSRDLVLAGTQQSVELKLALDQEQQKSRKLVQSMKKLDEEMRRTDELLYQMIPKQVADRIRRGDNPVETCQTFESVSLLFTDVVNFTDICTRITPLQVVSMLNHMYYLFDQLSERNAVYKVETVGDSYLVISGAPVATNNHAERICDMAMDVIDASEAIEDPSGKEQGLRVRVGCHSGRIVAGVVGIKMPKYAIFGDTVNTASRMESTSDPGKIQISEACKALLPSLYQYDLRGTINVKGKGEMRTYWLLGREARVPLSKYYTKTIIWTAPSTKLLEGISRSYDRPLSPTSTVNRSVESIGSASVSSSGTPTSKNQRVPAQFKNPSLRLKPQLEFKFTRRSTETNASNNPGGTSPAEPLRNPGNNVSTGFPNSQKLPMGTRRTFDDLEADENIQGYFNKNVEAKRKEQALAFQEKVKQAKIQPTTIYDSDLIKEALKSPIGRCTEKMAPITPSGSKTFDDEVAAVMRTGILNEATSQNNSPQDKKNPLNLPISTAAAGEGILTEYIMAVEKGTYEDKQKMSKVTSAISIDDSIIKEINTNNTEEVETAKDGAFSDDSNLDYNDQNKDGTYEEEERLMPPFKPADRLLTPECLMNDDDDEDDDDRDMAKSCTEDYEEEQEEEYCAKITRVIPSSLRRSYTDFISAKPGKVMSTSWDDSCGSFGSSQDMPLLGRQYKLPLANSDNSLLDQILLEEKGVGTATVCTKTPVALPSNTTPIQQKGIVKKPIKIEDIQISNDCDIKSVIKRGDKILEKISADSPVRITEAKDEEKEKEKQKDAQRRKEIELERARTIKEKEELLNRQGREWEKRGPAKEDPCMEAEKVVKINKRHQSSEREKPLKKDSEKTVTFKEGPGSGLSVKLAEIQVEKWIREEFADPRKESVDEDTDGESTCDQFAGDCDEKWIREELEDDLDGEEKWIQDKIPEHLSKDALNYEGKDFTSFEHHDTPKESFAALDVSKLQSFQENIDNSPKWQIEVRTTPLRRLEPLFESKEYASFDSPQENVKSMDNQKNQENPSNLNQVKEVTISLGSSSKSANPSKNESVIIETGMSQPSQTTVEVKDKNTNETVEKQSQASSSSEAIRLENIPSEVKVITHGVNSDRPKLGRSWSCSVDDVRGSGGQSSTGTSHDGADRYKVFSADFPAGPVPSLSSEIVNDISKSCTKLCYDCLSMSSFVDTDSLAFDLPHHNLQPDGGRKLSRKKAMKRKIAKLFRKWSTVDKMEHNNAQ